MKTIEFKKGDVVFDEQHRKVQFHSMLDDIEGYLGYPIYTEWDDDETDDDGEPVSYEVVSADLKFYPKLFVKRTYAMHLESQQMEQISRSYVSTSIDAARETLKSLQEQTRAQQDLIRKMKTMQHKSHLIDMFVRFMEGEDLWVCGITATKQFICKLSELKEHDITHEKLERMIYLNYDREKYRSKNWEELYDWKLSSYSDSSGNSYRVFVGVDRETVLNKCYDSWGKEFKHADLHDVKYYDFFKEQGIVIDEKIQVVYDEFLQKQKDTAKRRNKEEIERLEKAIERLKIQDS